MTDYLAIPGPIALSNFRRSRLAKEIGVNDVQARFVHYVSLNERLNEYDSKQLETTLLGLFDYGDADAGDLWSQTSSTPDIFHIYPRFGTVSPWSSKATAIAHVCQIKNVSRIERGTVIKISPGMHQYDVSHAESLIHDRMTQTISRSPPDLGSMFKQSAPASLGSVPLRENGSDPTKVLREANKRLGLALDEVEIQYLVEAYALGGPIARDPTDVELFMFSQINSEHCRHKQFNASWHIDGTQKPNTLFEMIRNTHEQSPRYTVSAYSDNAAVFEGLIGTFFAPDRQARGEWKQTQELVHFLGKVETHNHPTSVVPFEGAATGSGGEIRDEAAVGRGSRTKAGLCGFAVSDLLIPEFVQPWELPEIGYPGHVATGFKIMIDGPLGSASFNNEFGRPSLTGFFRTFLSKMTENQVRGYHKPIMLAGGLGSVRPQQALKIPELVRPGSKIVVMGGPAMLIGLGGGAASSQTSEEDSKELDFASVQRGNPEVQRRAQEVINACIAMGHNNPITFIHDVGAGGLSNAVPELLHDTNLGASIELREIDNADRGMSPLQIWCNEAQERYVLAVDPIGFNAFQSIADRERCRYSVVGIAEAGPSSDRRLKLTDRVSGSDLHPIDLSLSTLFGKTPKLNRKMSLVKLSLPEFDNSLSSYLPAGTNVLEAAVSRVLQLPSVASKMFLITIGDRTVGGLTCRDQLVGPWQTPVADCAVTSTSLTPSLRTGEAMAMGERPILALISPAASARMAVAESLTNIAASDLKDSLERIRLSANWMTAINSPGEAAAIYEAVEAIALGLCPELGVSIPVGKDSTSMKMVWKDAETGSSKSVTSPLSLVITAFAPVRDTRNTWTPTLRRPSEHGVGETILLLVDLAEGHRAMGGSALAQTLGQVGNEAPDVRNVQLLKDYFDAIEQLHEAGIVLAYHDVSDGGPIVCLTEMAIAGRCGINVMLDHLCRSTKDADIIPALFSEELGGVFQVRKSDEINFHRCFATCGPPRGLIKKIGHIPRSNANKTPQELAIYHGIDVVYRAPVRDLHRLWASTSYHMQRLRDNPYCADAEYEAILADDDPGLSYNLTFDPAADILPFASKLSNRLSITRTPRVAVLREQGVNGQAEMAFACMCAGFIAVDVHMTDLLSGRESLASFQGLAACGGFSQ